MRLTPKVYYVLSRIVLQGQSRSRSTQGNSLILWPREERALLKRLLGVYLGRHTSTYVNHWFLSANLLPNQSPSKVVFVGLPSRHLVSVVSIQRGPAAQPS